MSAIAALRAGVRAALEADTELGAAINGVFETRPARATPPWIELGETRESDWSAQGVDGREVRLTVIVRDIGETGARAERLAALASAAAAGVRVLADWRATSVALLGSRSGRAKSGEWSVVIELRARMART